MIILGVDSSSMVASVAISDDRKNIVNFSLNNNKTHSEKLLTMIDMALKVSKLSIKDVDLFVVSNGPGSFTGLRIGLSTIKGFAMAGNKRIVPVSTLEMLKESAMVADYSNMIICPIIHALKDEVFTAVFKENQKIVDDCSMKIADLIEYLSSYNQKVLFVGDGVLEYKEQLMEKMKDKAVFINDIHANGNAASLIEAGLREYEKGNHVSFNDVNPVYLKVSQAERLKNQGKE